MSRGLSVQTRFRPLHSWPFPSTSERRPRSAFRAGWQSTLDLLERELWYLDADLVVIEAGFREQDIRNDGLPRGNARQPDHPGVRIYFRGRPGDLSYATDAYELWQHNVRAIALGLEALRAVDRYGITKSGEQYVGWRAITAGPSTGGVLEPGQRDAPATVPARPVMDPFEACAVVARLAGWTTPPDPADPFVVQLAYKAAVRRTHPDLGGDQAGFAELTRAMQALKVAVPT